MVRPNCGANRCGERATSEPSIVLVSQFASGWRATARRRARFFASPHTECAASGPSDVLADTGTSSGMNHFLPSRLMRAWAGCWRP